jgi:hypothetical protein
MSRRVLLILSISVVLRGDVVEGAVDINVMCVGECVVGGRVD